MLSALVLVAALAHAAEPEEAPPIEVVVVEPGELSRAREALVDRFTDLGWRAHQKADGRVVFRGPRAWMGRAIFSASGDLGFRHPGGLWLPAPSRAQVLATPNTDVVPMSENQLALLGTAASSTPRAKLATFGPRTSAAAQRDVAAAVEPALATYRRTLWALALQERLARLHGELVACWEQGVPLDGGPTLPDAASRRRALLDHWATRTDTEEGRAVMRSVAAFLANVVMTSPTPVTAEERAAAEARRDDGARLDVGFR